MASVSKSLGGPYACNAVILSKNANSAGATSAALALAKELGAVCKK